MMAYSTDSKSAAVRAQLDHPVIDGDGHWLEPVPIYLDYLREVTGSTVVERFRKMATAHIDRGWYDMTPAERLDRRPTRPTWWGEPANTLDRATAMIPKLFYERLDDFGIDFAMLYTSHGAAHHPGAPLRRLARLREPLRLRPPLGQVRRAEGGGHRALRQHGLDGPRVGQQLHVQPHRPLRHRESRVRQSADPRRCRAPLPLAAVRDARGRRGLGLQPRDRPARPLGEAQRPRHGSPHATDEPRQAGAQRSLYPVRRARLRGEDGRADELPEPRAAVQVGRGDDRARVPRRAR